MGSILHEVPETSLPKFGEAEQICDNALPIGDDAAARPDGTKAVSKQGHGINHGGLNPYKPWPVNQVLLAWVLFLKRGSLGYADEELLVACSLEGAEKWLNLRLSDVKFDINENLNEGLRRIDGLMTPEQGEDRNLDSEKFEAVILKAGLADERGGMIVLFVVKACFIDNTVQFILQQCPPENTPQMTQVLTDALQDIFGLIKTEPQAPLSRTKLVQAHELAQIWDWNRTLPESINRGLHEYFVEKAQSHPQAWAVVSWDGRFTYGEINRMSTCLSHRLRRMGIDIGKAVPLCFEKSAWTVIAVMAVMKAGGAFVLTDPSQPETRLRAIAEEVKASIILTSEKHHELGQKICPQAEVLAVGSSLLQELENESETVLPPVPGSALMYIIFTSGSTGKPKGVMISHSNYTSGAIPRAKIVGYRENTRVLDFASYAFDVSIDCMLCTLATGGCICVPSEDARVNNLSGAIREMNVNMVHTTPSIARVFDADVIPSLDVLGLGGEAIPARDASNWNKQTQVVIAYGPSECTVGCAFNNNVGHGKSYTSLGRGCGGLLWVVDPENHNHLSPVGAAGELLVEGPIVGDGYLNEPDKTSAAFIENPPWLIQGPTGRCGRLYKTGDLVKYDPDGSGSVVFVGRKDQQVKIRGQRVELEEVEHHLRQHLPSKTAVAAEIINPGGVGDPVLAAFIAENSPEQGELNGDNHSFTNDFQALLHNLEEKLKGDVPKYMVPATYIAVPRIPTMVSGKTDRKQLRALGASLSRQQLSSWRAPLEAQHTSRGLSGDEQIIANIWAQLLCDGAAIRADDNFFALGGDSLKAMRLVALARKKGISLSIGTIFANPRLSDMAKNIGQRRFINQPKVPVFSLLKSGWKEQDILLQVASLCDVPKAEIEDVYPCTPLQEGLMALSSKAEEAYVAQRVLHLQDTNAAEKLRAAFDTAARDCPILRTRIVHVPRYGLLQVVLQRNLAWQSSNDLQKYLVQDRDEPVELGKSLCRFALVQENESAGVDFVLTMHHALYDGWSMPLIVDRVNKAYQGLETTRSADFKAFVKHLQSTDGAVSESYWRALLHEASDQQCPSLPYKGYQTQADSLQERYVNVRNASNSNNTLATIIRGAWALAAARHSGQNDIVFGETLTGRNADVPGIEEIEGPLITTVPMRIMVKRGIKVSEYLDHIHDQTVTRMPHEHFGLQNIRLLSADVRQACDLRTGIVLHPCVDDDESNRIAEGPANGLVPAGDTEAAQEALKFNSYALMLVCTLEKNGFLTMASFDSRCISEDAMDKLLADFDMAVQALSANPEQLLEDAFSLVNAQTRHTKSARILNDNPNTDSALRSGTALNHSADLNDKNALDESLSSREKLLAQLWRSILKIDGTDGVINSKSGFFDLGGDSIGAMKLVSELRQAEYRLTVAQIFQHRHLANMARALTPVDKIPSATNDIANSCGAQASETSIPRIEGKEGVQVLLANPEWRVECVYPVRPLQEVAVTGTIDLPRYSVRYDSFFFKDVDIDQDRLLRSCQQLVALHEILRTVFVQFNKKTLGVVIRDIDIGVDRFDIDTDLKSFSRALCDLDIQTVMPYGSPFVNFTFVQNSKARECCLIFRLSHAQYDELCLPVMLQNLSELYAGKFGENDISKKTQPFSRYVDDTIKVDIPNAVPYWRKLLEGSVMSVLPGPEGQKLDALESSLRTSELTSIFRTLDIKKRPMNVTLATFPTAAWAICLARRLSTRDIVFGEVASGRNGSFPGSDAVIGPCWQYIPFRLKFQPKWTGHDVLHAVQEQHIASSQHESMGLAEIVEQCTDWPTTTNWFDSVVHQAVASTDELSFGDGVSCQVDTYYPHLEPLREWKIQAFAGKDEMILEIVTFAAWRTFGEDLMKDLVKVFEQLVNAPEALVLE
ncbi:hypothetical protein H2198_004649 [Neophaeococcomyces mojaviensis]|uniref:Uncharacterized protein n=1 Tax=Neophaeococcomyces mojaviensis TaxID=3383035 RepID=A0ACC3A7X1_9EURO|nr:hypothetical protein H2198_004649 [Knufia sp. JES_112]